MDGYEKVGVSEVYLSRLVERRGVGDTRVDVNIASGADVGVIADT